ncbi:PP2C family protein-serine/threonine phosphatase [Demequina iriomotensis]|uniref:PP2C family protein-serine/threonine phosphatase n=1 Tax=Demequina iriomotensis TaxID=1536641 RepID=UPI000785E989|nr:protein phosphatase 2C domain-containing protein [Demequina iriomotensis]
MSAPVIVASGSASHTGLRRKLNEDAMLAAAPVFVVADGMGGHEAGELASAAVIACFGELAGRTSIAVDDARAALARARAAVDVIAEGGGPVAGTTLALAAIAEHAGAGYWLVVNVGDSRTYRLAGGRLEQISVDHSVVQEMVDDGEITPAEARTHRDRNVVTRAIGAGSHSEADFWLLPAATGDRVLVCSDGLTGEVDDELISDVLTSEPDPRAAADRLIGEALAAGGRDNVTVIVIDALAVEAGCVTTHDDDDDTVPRTPVEEAHDASV